jgi:hypothetical protein
MGRPFEDHAKAHTDDFQKYRTIHHAAGWFGLMVEMHRPRGFLKKAWAIAHGRKNWNTAGKKIGREKELANLFQGEKS